MSNASDTLVTYGDLVRDASRSVWAATAALASTRIADDDAARAAMTAWRNLIAATHRHGWVLLGNDQRAAAIRLSADADPRDLAAAAFVDAVAPLAARHHPDRPVIGGDVGDDIAGRWAAAARSLGAASDLLGTHRHADGTAASPAAWELDDRDVRAAGYAHLADLTIATLGAADTLALRAGQAGARWREVAREIPPPSAALDAAIGLRLACRGAGTEQSRIASFTVARPPIRPGDPVIELGGRIARLHRASWELHRHPHASVTAIGDLAAVAVMVHEAAAVTMRRVADGRPLADLGFVQDAGVLRDRGIAWRGAVLELRKMRTANPGHAGIRGDAVAVKKLLGHVTDRAPGVDPARTLPHLLHAARALPDLARYADVALAEVASRGELYVRGRSLTGEEVTDSPILATAKLTDRLALAPAQTVDAARALLRDAGRPATAQSGHEGTHQARSAART